MLSYCLGPRPSPIVHQAIPAASALLFQELLLHYQTHCGQKEKKDGKFATTVRYFTRMMELDGDPWDDRDWNEHTLWHYLHHHKDNLTHLTYRDGEQQ